MPCVTLPVPQAKAGTLMAPPEVALPWSRGPPHKAGAWPPPQSAPRAENATQCSDCLSHGFSTEVLVENIRMPVVGIGIPGRACGHFDVYFFHDTISFALYMQTTTHHEAMLSDGLP